MALDELTDVHRTGNGDMRKLLLTVREAADVLGIGRSKAYELIGRGELRSVQIDGCRRVPTAALDEYVTWLLEGAV